MTLTKRALATPDETRPFQAHGRMQVVALGDITVGKGTFEPGWRWSKDVKPIAGGDSCQANHTGYILSGRMHIRMNDGAEVEVGPGDIVTIPPGHDAWTLGDEPCLMLDWTGVAKYAKKA